MVFVSWIKRFISRCADTVSFWIMVAALFCFGLVFFVSTWRNPAPPYRLLLLLFLPAVLYGVLTLVESRWKYGSAAAGIGGILAIPIFLTCVVFWFGIGLVSQTTDDPALYARVYRFHKDLPGMSYFPARIPEEAEDADFHYSNITFAPGRDRAKYIRLTCSGLDLADIHERYAAIALRTESEAAVTEYILWDSPWQSDDWSEEKDIYCSVAVDAAEETVCYSIRIEI